MVSMDRNYDILGIPETASVDDIKKAYKRLALEHHPDRNHGDNAQASRFREITETYRVISSQFGRKHDGQSNNKPLKTDYTPKKETTANPYFNFRAEKERLVSKLRYQRAHEEQLISDKNEGLVLRSGRNSFKTIMRETELTLNILRSEALFKEVKLQTKSLFPPVAESLFRPALLIR